MELINFTGLNCYHNCIVSIANNSGLDYCRAFSSLWSETDFRYEAYRKVYLSRRLIENFKLLGLSLKMMLCFSPDEAEKSLAEVDNGEFFIVGMDAFFIPWNQFYKTFHGPHYFIAKKERAEKLLCFDPTYGSAGESIATKTIIEHAFDISCMRAVEKSFLPADIKNEAASIIHICSEARQEMLPRIIACEHSEGESIILLAKYIDALISSRYLFSHYLMAKRLLPDSGAPLFGREYFSGWTAVKNGLYKTAVHKSRCAVVQEVCCCFNRVLDSEVATAHKILQLNG